MVTEQVRQVVVRRAAVAFDEFLRKNGISDTAAGKAIGVSRVTIGAWRKGEKVPEGPNQERIELFCARVNSKTGEALKGRKTGHWNSHVPREWWAPEGETGGSPVQPFAARAASAPASGAR